MHVLGAFIAGLLVATVTTPAGVSGAVLLLPIQVSVLGVPSPSVTPTNLIFNLLATPSGVLRYRRLQRGSIISPLAVRLLAGTVPGVIVGAVIRVEWLSGQRAFYLAAAAVLATLGAMLVLRQPAPADRPLRLAFVSPIAACVGVVGGIYGIGGGSFLAPILILGGYTAYAVAPAALLSTLVASVVGVITFVDSRRELERLQPDHSGLGHRHRRRRRGHHRRLPRRRPAIPHPANGRSGSCSARSHS